GPQHQGVVSARWADPDWIDVTLRIRAEGIQFANDLNTFKLPGYATVDLYVARELRELMNNVKAFVAVKNLFDNREKPDRHQYRRPAHSVGRFENSLLIRVVIDDTNEGSINGVTDDVSSAKCVVGHRRRRSSHG